MQAHKTIMITGASSGIGKECARIFAKSGCHLILGARRVERLKELEAELVSLGASSVYCDFLDVCSTESIDTFCRQALEHSKNKIDVLLNNAGLALGTEHIKDAHIDDWERMINTNVLGLVKVTKQILPSMLENNSGHIVMIGSIAGHEAYEGGSVYCASKFAVSAITKSLRLEVCGTGVRVTSVDPGMVETEFSFVRLKDQEKANAVYKGMTPLNPIDIAECVEFAVNRPPHVNVDDILVMPTCQASVYKTARKS